LKRLVKLFVSLLFIIILLVTVILFSFRPVKKVYAIENWSDNLTCFPDSYSKLERAHIWANNFSNYYQDVYIELQSLGNSSMIKFYRIIANNTCFLNITDSQIIVSNFTYYNLRQNEKLVFDVYAKVRMSGMFTVTVTFKVYLVLIGDIDRNDWINIYDGILLGNSWGYTSSNPNWDVKRDLNKDDVINIYDGILLSSHFGEKM
jgi:hypothetical protein